MHPLFDPSGFSDQELDEKLKDINQKIILANRNTGNTMLIRQIQSIRESILAEQQDRSVKEYTQQDRGTGLVTGGYDDKEEKNNG